jgi:ketosteroid isomerase-like protein
VRARAALLALATAATTAAQPAGVENEVKAAEARRYQAMIAGDLAALDALLADDLLYVHSSGAAEDKQAFLGSLRGGQLRYKKITPEGVSVRDAGRLAIVRGRSAVEVERDGKPQAFRIHFTAIYEKSAAGWRLSGWQSTRLPQN